MKHQILLILLIAFSCVFFYYVNHTRKEPLLGIMDPEQDFSWLKRNTKWVSRAQVPSKLPGIDRIYAIVLPKRKDSFMAIMRSMQLEDCVHVLDAFQKDRVDQLFPYKGGLYSLPTNEGRVACNISHAMILLDFIESDAKTAMIFEDDIVPISGSENARFHRFLEAMQSKTWDFLHAGFHQEEITPDEVIKEGPFRAYTPLNCHAYAVNRKAARTLMPLIFPATWAIDRRIVELTRSEQLVSYAINPPIFYQNRTDFKSELGTGSNQSPFVIGNMARDRDQI